MKSCTILRAVLQLQRPPNPWEATRAAAAATLGAITDTTLADATAQLGDWRGLEISFKRDDLISFAFGDNKVRGL